MAHDLESKAAAFALFAVGKGISEVATALGIAKSTIKTWNNEWEEKTGDSSFEVKQRRFAEKFADAGVALLEMHIAHAVMLSDSRFVKNFEMDDVIKLAAFTRDSFAALNSASRIIESSALPERSEAVEGIPVDESEL